MPDEDRLPIIMSDRRSTIRELLAPALARVEEAQYPLLFALAEREAARRYRSWAQAAENGASREGLLRCADREDEIAERIEGLFPDAARLQEDILARIPNFAEINQQAFEGLSMVEQYALQAAGERAGTETWTAFAAQAPEAAAKEVFLTCARLEAESADYLDAMSSDASPMDQVVRSFRRLVVEAGGRLRRISQEAALQSRGEGKWTVQEILGHLVDSASNNHQRFVRAQLQDSMVFLGYEQDRWVAVQRYQQASWPNLVTLWESFNLHLAAVMAATPDDLRLRPCRLHNLHEIAWELQPQDEPVTLDFFMRDYVAHLEHHLRQIDPTLAVPR